MSALRDRVVLSSKAVKKSLPVGWQVGVSQMSKGADPRGPLVTGYLPCDTSSLLVVSTVDLSAMHST